jgi:hypothetical protein
MRGKVGRDQALNCDIFRSASVQRRKAGWVHEIPVNVVHQRSVFLRFGLNFFPFRVGLKIGPILLRFLTAWMLQNVNEKVLRTRRVFGRPIPDAFHIVPPKNRVGVIAKPSFQFVNLAGINVIQAQLVNVMWRFCIRSTQRVETEYQRRAAKKS